MCWCSSLLAEKAGGGQCKETGDGEATGWGLRSPVAQVASTVAQFARYICEVKFGDRLVRQSRTLDHCGSATAAHHSVEPHSVVYSKVTNTAATELNSIRHWTVSQGTQTCALPSTGPPMQGFIQTPFRENFPKNYKFPPPEKLMWQNTGTI